MQVSKKNISLLTVTIFLGLLLSTTMINAIGVNTDPLPQNALQWDITNLQVIDGSNYYVNEIINVQTGGELRILNSNLYFNLTSLRIDIQQGGILYVENSNITVTNSAYTYTITSVAKTDLPSSGSNYTFIDSKLINARISISQYGSKFCKFISTNTTFDNFEIFRIQNTRTINIQESTFFNSTKGVEIVNANSITVQYNSFQLLDFGLDISSSTGGTIGYNNFLDIATTGLIVDDFSRVNVQNLPQVKYEWNTFDNMVTGAQFSDSRVNFINNDLRNLEIGTILDNSDYGTYQYNNYTAITDKCITADVTAATTVKYNNFVDSNIGIDLLKSPITINNNQFENLTSGVIAYDSDGIKIFSNILNNISYYSIQTDESREIQVYSNTITNSLGGIFLTRARSCLVQENNLDTVEDGIAVTYSRDIRILGNTVNNTISGYYIETTSEIVLTANGAIHAQYGINLWSVTDALLASNGVFESIYGVSIWFSENIEVTGNHVNTSAIGIVGRNTYNLVIIDGTYVLLTKGIQLLGCIRPRIIGNTFNSIAEEATTLSHCNNFIVYNNNFLTVGNYGDIENSFGTFYTQIDNETYIGNYYQGGDGSPVLIDVFTVGTETYNVTDYYPLNSRYNVKPSVEFLGRNYQNPTDVQSVIITTQIFIPEDTENVLILLQYNLVNETFWREIDITSTNDKIGSIGAISQFQGTISPLPYDFVVSYRIMVNYTIDAIAQSIVSSNSSYTVAVSEFTPIVIGKPEVRVVTYSEAEGQEITVITNSYYEGLEYFIFVKITNRTDFQMIAGRRHVNLSWYEMDPSTNETQFFTGIMDYNSTTTYYYATFGRDYTIGMVLEYYISVVDINGTIYRTVLNYTMIIEPPVEKTGFDTITLVTIGGTLLIIQVIVVYRRRKSKEEK